MKNFLLFLFLMSSPQIFAQLGFCEGSKGDPIFHEDFGSGSTGAPLPAGVTSYTYVTGRDPADGFYTVSTRIGLTYAWHTYLPETTISNGLALIVNADFNSGLFYQREILDLCENTSYEFSAFLMNVHDKTSGVCDNQDIPIDVRFEIWDETNTRKLKEGSTGSIVSTNTPIWNQHALTFQTEPGQEKVILKMFNNGEGGCGNDLAIDDIIFRSCGDFTEVSSDENEESPLNICESQGPVSVRLQATPDFSVYDHHSYQWQESQDEQNWQIIPGETNNSFNTPVISETKYFRVKVAEDEINLNNNLCSSASESFRINFISTPAAPQSNGDIVICSNEEIPALSVSVANDESVNWYDATVNGNLLAEATSRFTPDGEGVFYAEAVKQAGCGAGPRTAVSLVLQEAPDVEDEALQWCQDSTIQLDAGVNNMEYIWSTGETTKTILVSSAGNYNVQITTAQGCKAIKNIQVESVDVAGIEEIISEEDRIIISGNEGEFEYSIDGVNFQSSNIFEEVRGGVYTAYVRDLLSCNTVSQEFPHIVVQRYMTPNGDGFNDTFRLRGADYFSSSFVKIFDRYGKLIKSGDGNEFSWDGTFNGNLLPDADYWYEIYIENFRTIKGHVTLIN